MRLSVGTMPGSMRRLKPWLCSVCWTTLAAAGDPDPLARRAFAHVVLRLERRSRPTSLRQAHHSFEFRSFSTLRRRLIGRQRRVGHRCAAGAERLGRHIVNPELSRLVGRLRKPCVDFLMGAIEDVVGSAFYTPADAEVDDACRSRHPAPIRSTATRTTTASGMASRWERDPTPSTPTRCQPQRAGRRLGPRPEWSA